MLCILEWNLSIFGKEIKVDFEQKKIMDIYSDLNENNHNRLLHSNVCFPICELLKIKRCVLAVGGV